MNTWKMTLLISFLLVVPAIAEVDHDLQNKNNSKKRIIENGNGTETGDVCDVQASDLVSIANGENSNIQPVVSFLTRRQCSINAKKLSAQAIAEGITFNAVPFHLDNFAKGYSNQSVEGTERIDRSLSQIIPPIMSEHPMPQIEQIPLIAQLAILSRTTGLWALANMVKQELISGAQLLPDVGGKPLAQELAKNLVRMGVNEPLVATELATSVEEMALLVQADSLGKVLRALAAVASEDDSLVPAFNLSASAFNRGVQNGKKEYKTDEQNRLTLAAFQATKGSLKASHSMEPGLSDINDVFGTLLFGKNINETGLKKLWKEVVRVLALTPLMPNLAEMVALSITPSVSYLEKRQQDYLLGAAKTYPQIAQALQRNFLLAWATLREELQNGKVTVKIFNEKKEKFFEPLVESLLDLEPSFIDPFWLKEVVKRGMVSDQIIEKRFPRLVLALIQSREKAAKTAVQQEDIKSAITSMAQNFGILWMLSNIHVPALRKWVEKYDE